eukprot:scaffold317259_cov18-Prasinocladus_malaysianus.AAC.2
MAMCFLLGLFPHFDRLGSEVTRLIGCIPSTSTSRICAHAGHVKECHGSIGNGRGSLCHAMIVGYRGLNNERTDAWRASAASTRLICRQQSTQSMRTVCKPIAFYISALPWVDVAIPTRSKCNQMR